MRKINLKLTAFGSLLLFVYTSSAQTADSFYQSSFQNTVNRYFTSLGENSHLFTGPEYAYYGNNMDGSPFLASDSMRSGVINFDGIVYANIPLSYDVVLDQVIIRRYNDDIRIRIINEKVKYFSFSDRIFERIEKDSSSASIIGTGFYERLYNGATLVYAKRKKKVEKILSTSRFSYKLISDDSYYIQKKGVFYPIKNKAAAIAAFTEKKKEISQYLRKNKMNYKQNPEGTLIMIASYYDQLTN